MNAKVHLMRTSPCKNASTRVCVNRLSVPDCMIYTGRLIVFCDSGGDIILG